MILENMNYKDPMNINTFLQRKIRTFDEETDSNSTDSPKSVKRFFFPLKKRKDDCHYFSKLKCKDIVKKVFSYLSDNELFTSIIELPNRNLSNILLSYFKDRFANCAYFRSTSKFFLYNSLSVNESEKALSLFFKNFEIKDNSLPQNTKYFVSDPKTDTLYSLSYRTLTIKKKNKANKIITLNDYLTHFQLISEYDKNLIALFTLDKIQFLNIKTSKIVFEKDFSSEYLEYIPALKIFVAFSDVSGNICIINPTSKLSIISNLFDCEVSGFSLGERYPLLMCFYSSNPKEDKDKRGIKVFDLYQTNELEVLTTKNNSNLSHACCYGKFIIGIDKEFIYHWDIGTFKMVSMFSLGLVGKEIYNGMQYVKEVNENVFVVFYEEEKKFKGKILILQKKTGRFLTLDIRDIPKSTEKKKRVFYHMIKKRENREVCLQFYSSEVPLGKSTKVERDDYIITYL